MKLIIGLGNPGKQYERTRHNIGFMVIDEISRKLNFVNFREKFKGKLVEGNYNGEKLLLLKPQTYMNLSGESIFEITKFYKLDVEKDILVVYDDMSMKFGKLRIRELGSAGGHNGIKSIISQIGDRFLRLKIGIGSPKENFKIINHVIGSFTKDEEEKLKEIIEESSEISLALLRGEKKDKVLQKYNKKL